MMGNLAGSWTRFFGLLLSVACLAAPSRPALAQPEPTHANLNYATVSGGLGLHLDLYIPAGACGHTPVVVYLHGGGWLGGSKADVAPHTSKLLQRGLAVASINYRLSYQANFPAQIYDCKGAVRWLRAHASQYNLDPNWIGVFGESAGGHLAALLGTSGGVSSLEGSVGGNTSYSSRVQAVVDISGPTDLFALGAYHGSATSEESLLIGHSIPDIIDHIEDEEYADLVALVNLANPILRASSDDPPLYIAHGGSDDLIPPSQATMLADALDDVGAEVVLRIVPGSEHEIPASEFTATYNFLAAHLPSSGSAIPPQIVAIGNATASAGQAYQGPMPALTQPACMGPVNWSLVSGPSGMSINSNSGVVTWSSPSVGSHTIVIRAQNNLGSDSESWTLTVQPQPTSNLTRRYTFNGHGEGEQFGKSVANAGDVNNDGWDDFVIGAPGNSENGQNAGKVYVYSGRTGSLMFSVRGRNVGDRFGRAVSSAGDLNNDGRSDFLIGAPNNDENGVNSGKVYVYAGGSWSLLRSRSGQNSGDRFGWSLAGGLELASQPRDCYLVGAPRNDAAGPDAGAVYLYTLTNGTDKLLRIVRGQRPGEQFGYSVARIGNVDGQDNDQFVVGAPLNDDAGKNAGKIYVYAGHTGALVRAKSGQRAGDQFGKSVAGGGDFDGDQNDDFAAGAFSFDASATPNAGRSYSFNSHNGVNLWKATGATANNHLGFCVSVCGDVNGDGYDDLLIGSNTDNSQGPGAGSARVCSGANGSVLARVYGESAGSECGYAVAGAGDVNNDGKADLLIAAPFHNATGFKSGRVYVYLAP